MGTVQIASIVEGYGEVKAVPVLLQRIAHEIDPSITALVPEPIRVSKGKLKRSNELGPAVQLAYQKIGGQGGILILLDSDDDCPAELGPSLLREAQQARHDALVSVVSLIESMKAGFLLPRSRYAESATCPKISSAQANPRRSVVRRSGFRSAYRPPCAIRRRSTKSS